MKDFRKIRTGTQRKKDIESIVYDKNLFKIPYKKHQYVAGLCGSCKELDRHINNYIKLGIPESKIIFYEYNPKIYKSIKAKIKRDGRQCIIRNEDIRNTINYKDENYYLIDFDGVWSASQEVFDYPIYWSSGKYSTYLIYVFSGRYPPKNKIYMEKRAKELKMSFITKNQIKPESEYTEKEKERAKMLKMTNRVPSSYIKKKVANQIPKIVPLYATHIKNHNLNTLLCTGYRGGGGHSCTTTLGPPMVLSVFTSKESTFF